MSSAMEIAMKDLSELIAAAASPQSAIDALKAETVTGIFNVKSGFGAVGDGVTDDTAAIQSAIDAANTAGGGVVYLPPGKYLTTNELTIYPNIVICGAGRESTFIYPSTLGQTTFSLVSGTLTRVYAAIENIGIVAKATNIKGIYTVLSSALRFTNIFFGGCETNFHLDRGSNVQILHILVEGTASPSYKAGKSIFEDSTGLSYLFDLEMTDYQIRNLGNGCQTPSLTFKRVVASMVRGFHVNDLTAGGGNADGILISDDCQGLQISDSIIVKPFAYGIKTVTANGFTPIALEFTSVDIDQSQLHGIYLENGFWININGGQISSFVDTGIYIGSTNTLVQGVTMSDGGIKGINVKAGINHFRILGNHIEGCDTAVNIEVGASTSFNIMGNHLSVNNVNKIVDGSTGTSKNIRFNIGASDILTREYTASLVFSLTGGAATETINVAIPSGLFSQKPETGFLMLQSSVTSQIIGFYSYGDVGNSATNAVFVVARNDNAVLSSGSFRFGVLLKG
jgi:hypothetical protein